MSDPSALFYVYGVVRADLSDDVVAEVAERAGRDLALVREEGLGAVVEPRPPGESSLRRDDVLAHSEVLNELAVPGPVIPLALGTLVEGEDGARGMLADQAPALAAALDELTDHVQLTVRAEYDQEAVLAEVVSEDPEVAALRERTRELSEQEGYGDRVRLGELVAAAMAGKVEQDTDRALAALAPHSVRHAVTVGAGLDRLFDVAFLVRTDKQEDFEAAAEALAYDWRDRVRLSLLGPLAPFEFVQGMAPWAS